MTLREELDHWRAEEQRLAIARAAAWDRDPGNTFVVHVLENAHGFHRAFTEWAAARDRVAALEKKLAEQEVAA